ALLNVVYPHYTRPIPSLSLVQFVLDPEQGKLTTGLRIPKDTDLYSRPVAGTPCRFRTCYETTLWPVTIAAAKWVTPHELKPAVRAPDAVAALRLELACLPDVTFEQLELETLRLHISADANLASTLYELLCNNCIEILVRDPTPGSGREPLVLPASALEPAGFGEDEGLLPTPRRSFLGYRLLQEDFTFPDKVFLLDVGRVRWGRAAAARSAGRLSRLPAAPGVRHVSRRVLLPGPGRVRAGAGGGVRRACGGGVPDLAVRAERAAADARDGCDHGDVPAGLHAHREPVPQDIRAGAADAAAERVPADRGRAAARLHGHLLGRGGEGHDAGRRGAA